MYCPQQIAHTVRRGDTLYLLARYYRTTVEQIMALNPSIAPRNLQIGSILIICPGKNYIPTQPCTPVVCPTPEKQIELNNSMRSVWEQHAYWTRMLIISIAGRLADEAAVTERLLRNPQDVARIFARYFPAEAVNRFSTLLTQHLQIGAALITALRDGDTARAETLNTQWYQNADQLAEALSEMSPYYDQDEMREMFHRHLDLTTQEAAMRLAGNYPADIAAFEKALEQMLDMADSFIAGIVHQFPELLR